MIERFLSLADTGRALRTLRKLSRHKIESWALTGGLALEIHRLLQGCLPVARALNDLDFVTSSFDRLSESLADDFMFRHIHPLDPPGKMMLQFIDPDTALRVDVFRASGETMSRTRPTDTPAGTIQLVSLGDLTARSARLVLDLAEGLCVESKHARDFLRLAELATLADIETAWTEHRKPNQPCTFDEARSLLHDLILTRQDLLITGEYSRDTEKECPRCKPIAGFRLADAKRILSLLGYC